MKDLDRIVAFVRVIEKGSFFAAAKDLNVSASVVSRLVSQLEADVGVLLLRRSTRRLSVTDAGANFYAHCASALASIKSAKEMAAEQSDSSKGVINIQASLSVGLKVIAPAIRAFTQRYPDVSFNVNLSDVPARVIDGGYDIVIIQRPTSREKSVACRVLRPVRYLICASQAYLKKHGTPAKPADLVHFNCLVNDKQVRPNEWRFIEGGREVTVKVRGNLRMNDGLGLHDAVMDGMGIARLPDYHVEADLKQGGLRIVFDNVLYDTRTITAAYPRSKFTPPRLSLFLDFLEAFARKGGSAAPRPERPPAKAVG